MLEGEMANGAGDVETVKEVRKPKTIVLFSDGTGNSSGKLFKTNVWRMYEAVDLGPSPPGTRDQIAYYDNGVGTTSFRPLRMLQGVFGWGLKRNVLEIYRYACRNYQPGEKQKAGEEPGEHGDHFYGFGFSRGAFTMRLAIDLIAEEGIVTFGNERELARKSRQAFRHWLKKGAPKGVKALPARGWHFIGRNIFSPIRRWFQGAPKYDPTDNYKPVIRFIGVWDTVAAYGGPIIEVTRAIDMFIYPLSLSSYRLNPRVGCARHALALDDERDSFHPLLWDEVHEHALVTNSESGIGADRLQQVWFTGMHADVGGGYPDESLSYVSLLWMMEEAEKHGLRTLDVITERFIALANSFGPIHDSRGGLASYYRYQPRKIAALGDEEDPKKARKTLSLRDPSIRDAGRRRRGLLCGVKVHESVIARVAYGTDSYAPITLPGEFAVVPPGMRSEAQPQAVSDSPPGCRRAKAQNWRHTVLEESDRARLTPAVVTTLGLNIESAWNLVWVRRIVYFATVLATIALASLPLWGDWNPLAPDEGGVAAHETLLPNDDRNWLGNLVRLPTAFLPEFLHGWVEGLARSPYWLLGLILLILVLNGYARRLERVLRDRAVIYWNTALGKEQKTAPAKKPGIIARMMKTVLAWVEARTEFLRLSGPYQWALSLIKWYLLPTVIGIVMLALSLWAALAVATQIALPTIESGETMCTTSGATDWIERSQIEFRTDTLCNAAGGRVRENVKYTITFQVMSEWKDGSHPATPVGLGPLEIGWAGPFGVPLRRVVNARYLQPIVEIRGDEVVQIHAPAIEELPGDRNEYRLEFTAPIQGELFLFANDSVLPVGIGFNHAFFYDNNQGAACVTIEAEGATVALPAPATDSLCGKPAAPRRIRPGPARAGRAPAVPR